MIAPTDTTDAASDFIIPRSQWPRVFLIAVVLPLLMTAINTQILGSTTVRGSLGASVAVLSVYIVEMALIAAAAGAGIRQAWLAWTLFAWLVLMNNLQLIVATACPINWWTAENGLAVAAFAVAEGGLLIVWAILGYQKWYWRLTVALATALCILLLSRSFGPAFDFGQWSSIVWMEYVSIAILAATLRFAGFRLRELNREVADAKLLQFGVRHMMILTGVLAVGLGVARAAEMLTWPFWRQIMRDIQLWRVAIACPSAILIVLVFWAALGKGAAWLRVTLLGAGCLGIGFTMALWAAHIVKVARSRFGWSSDLYEQLKFAKLGYWWIAWYCLSTGLLFACLLFFRMRGYRLGRSSRSR